MSDSDSDEEPTIRVNLRAEKRKREGRMGLKALSSPVNSSLHSSMKVLAKGYDAPAPATATGPAANADRMKSSPANGRTTFTSFGISPPARGRRISSPPPSASRRLASRSRSPAAARGSSGGTNITSPSKVKVDLDEVGRSETNPASNTYGNDHVNSPAFVGRAPHNPPPKFDHSGDDGTAEPGARKKPPLVVPLNNKDNAALKVGRLLMTEIKQKYGNLVVDLPESTANDQSYSRFFVDKWLSGFHPETKEKDLSPLSMEMLTRLQLASAIYEKSMVEIEEAGEEESIRSAGRLSPATVGFLSHERRQKPTKDLVVTACQVMDEIIKDLPQYPALGELRKIFFKPIFIDAGVAEEEVVEGGIAEKAVVEDGDKDQAYEADTTNVDDHTDATLSAAAKSLRFAAEEEDQEVVDGLHESQLFTEVSQSSYLTSSAASKTSSAHPPIIVAPPSPTEQKRALQQSIWDASSRFYHSKKLWCESDSEKKLADAHKIIAAYEEREAAHEKNMLERDIECAGLRKEKANHDAVVEKLTKELNEAKVNATMQVAYKASLRTMLDSEKEKLKTHKSEAEKELKKAKEVERKKASEATEKLSKAQKKAVEKLKEVEIKYKKSVKTVADRDAELALKEKEIVQLTSLSVLVESLQKKNLDAQKELESTNREASEFRRKLEQRMAVNSSRPAEGAEERINEMRKMHQDAIARLQQEHQEKIDEHVNNISMLEEKVDFHEKKASEEAEIVHENAEDEKKKAGEEGEEETKAEVGEEEVKSKPAEIPRSTQLQIDALKNQVSKLRSQLAEANEKNIALAEENKAAVASAVASASVPASRDEDKNKIAISTEEMAKHEEVKQHLEEQKKSVGELTDLVEKLEEQNEKKTEQMRRSMEANTNQIDKLKSELERVRNELAATAKDAKNYEGKFNKLQEKLTKQQVESEESKKIAQELGEAKTANEKKLLEELGDVQAEIDRTKELLKQLETDNTELRKKLGEERLRRNSTQPSLQSPEKEPDLRDDTDARATDVGAGADVIDADKKNEVEVEAAMDDGTAVDDTEIDGRTSDKVHLGAEDDEPLSDQFKEAQSELKEMTTLYDQTNDRNTAMSKEISDQKRRIGELEEICAKLESTLQKTSSAEGGDKISGMLKALKSREKFQKTTKRLMTTLKMAKSFPGTGGGAGIFGGAGKLKKVEEPDPDSEDNKAKGEVLELKAKAERDELERKAKAERDELELKAKADRDELERKAKAERDELERKAEKEKEELVKEMEAKQASFEENRKRELEESQQLMRDMEEKMKQKMEKELAVFKKKQAELEEEAKEKPSILAEAEKEKQDAMQLMMAKEKELQNAMRKTQEEMEMALRKKQMEQEAAMAKAKEEQEVAMRKAKEEQEAALAKIKEEQAAALLRAKEEQEDALKEQKEKQAAAIRRAKAEQKAAGEKELKSANLFGKMNAFGQKAAANKKLNAAEAEITKLKQEKEDREKAEREREKEKSKKEKELAEISKGLSAPQIINLIKVLLAQRKDLEKSTAKIAIAKREDLSVSIDKLRSSLNMMGGWREVLYLESGGIDLEFDLEPWSEVDQVKVLQEIKSHLQKRIAKEATEAASAFFEVDQKRDHLLKERNKNDQLIERQRAQVVQLKDELAKLIARSEQEKIFAKEQAEQMESSTVGNVKTEELTRDELLKRMKSLQREKYRERLAVNELLKSVDDFYAGVGSLCIDESEDELLDKLIAEAAIDEVGQFPTAPQQENTEQALMSEVNNVERIDIGGLLNNQNHNHKNNNSELGRQILNRKQYQLSRKTGPAKKKREILQPESTPSLRPQTAPGVSGKGSIKAQKNSKLVSLLRRKKQSQPPKTKASPDLCGDEFKDVSILPFLMAKKKSLGVLYKYLDRRLLFGKDFKTFEEKLKNVEDFDKIHDMARNANSKLVHHQREIVQLNTYLEQLLKKKQDEVIERVEVFSNTMLQYSGNASKSLLDYNESVLSNAAKGLGRPSSAVPLFVSRGEYLENMTPHTRNNDSVFTNFAHTAGLERRREEMVLGQGGDQLVFKH